MAGAGESRFAVEGVQFGCDCAGLQGPRTTLKEGGNTRQCVGIRLGEIPQLTDPRINFGESRFLALGAGFQYPEISPD
jgi:hypothetical protein